MLCARAQTKKKKKKNLLKCYKLLQIGKPSNSFAVFPKLLQSQSVDSKVDAFLLIFTPAFQKKIIIIIIIFCFKHFSSTQASKITYVCLFFLFVHRLLSIETHLQNGQH